MQRFLLLAALSLSTAAMIGCTDSHTQTADTPAANSSFKQGGATGTGNTAPNLDPGRDSSMH